MVNRQSFLREICANPHDDGPREVFADWLEEHGEGARAEFIRLQIRLANMPLCNPKMHLELRGIGLEYSKKANPKCPVCIAKGPLEKRAAELLVEHRSFWLSELFLESRCCTDEPNGMDVKVYVRRAGILAWVTATFARGFPERLCCTWDAWDYYYFPIIRNAPIRTVEFSDMPPIEFSVNSADLGGMLRTIYVTARLGMHGFTSEVRCDELLSVQRRMVDHAVIQRRILQTQRECAENLLRSAMPGSDRNNPIDYILPAIDAPNINVNFEEMQLLNQTFQISRWRDPVAQN